MKIASWNVNSIKARLPAVIEWLDTAAPDVLALQEIKCTADTFPFLEIEAAGYRATVLGQKTYNGVALLSKTAPESVHEGLPDDGEGDDQARYVEAVFDGVSVASIYLPNGNPVASDKFPYKLSWMARLKRHAARLLAEEVPTVLGGDFNVIPEPEDCYDPDDWTGDALYRPETRRAFREILHQGWTDAFRSLHARRGGAFTFWDYQRGRWQRGEGIRIDHLLLSPAAVDRLEECDIDTVPRSRPKASDHTPIWCSLGPAPPAGNLFGSPGDEA